MGLRSVILQFINCAHLGRQIRQFIIAGYNISIYCSGTLWLHAFNDCLETLGNYGLVLPQQLSSVSAFQTIYIPFSELYPQLMPWKSHVERIARLKAHQRAGKRLYPLIGIRSKVQLSWSQISRNALFTAPSNVGQLRESPHQMEIHSNVVWISRIATTLSTFINWQQAIKRSLRWFGIVYSYVSQRSLIRIQPSVISISELHLTGALLQSQMGDLSTAALAIWHHCVAQWMIAKHTLSGHPKI